MRAYLDYQQQRIVERIKGFFSGKSGKEVNLRLEANLVLDHDLKNEPVEFSHEQMPDFKRNIARFSEDLWRIKEKYSHHLVDKYVYFGQDGYLKGRIKEESYCRTHGLTPEHLPYIQEGVEKRLNQEVRLAEIDFLIRDDNCALSELEEALKLLKDEEALIENEMIRVGKFVGAEKDKARLKAYTQLLEEAKIKDAALNQGRIIKTTRRDSTKWRIANKIMGDVALNIGPHWVETRDDSNFINWERKLALLEERLKKEGVYLNKQYEAAPKHEALIEQTWQEINEEEKNERDQRSGLEKTELEKLTPEQKEALYDLFIKNMAQRYPDRRFRANSVLRDISPQKFEEERRRFYSRALEDTEVVRNLQTRVQEMEKEKAERPSVKEKIPLDKGAR